MAHDRHARMYTRNLRAGRAPGCGDGGGLNLTRVMATSQPPLFYLGDDSLRAGAVGAVDGGLRICYSVDAGPNVHVLTSQTPSRVARRLQDLKGVRGHRSVPGGAPACSRRTLGSINPPFRRNLQFVLDIACSPQSSA
jgi:hypothetical protein